jgi:hypothetical protein
MLGNAISEIEHKLEASLELNNDHSHPLHNLVHSESVLSMGTGSTDNACQVCSPSSQTRCAGYTC